MKRLKNSHNQIMSDKYISFFIFLGKIAMANTKIVNVNAPTGIAFNKNGDMFVTEWSGRNIWQIDAKGNKKSIANISSPAGIAIDDKDNIYISSYSDDYIMRVDNKGKQEIISRDYHTPTGIFLTKNNTLIITNRATGELVELDLRNNQKKVIADQFKTPVGVVQLNNGDFVVSQYGGYITLLSKDGKRKELGGEFERPGVGIIVDSDSEVVVVDNGKGELKRVNIQSGQTTLVAKGLLGIVALAKHNNRYFVGLWDDNAVKQINAR